MKAPTAPAIFRHHFSSMGCPAEIVLYAGNAEYAASAIAGAESEVHRLDHKYSHYRRDSELELMLQQASRARGVRVDDETAALLNFAATQHQVSAGLFDITAGRLTALWDRAQAVPQAQQIHSALALTGWHRVDWDGTRLHVPRGMRLDLGGVVKEYAADRAALQLKSAGIQSGYIDLGGDLHFLGPHPDGSAWRAGVRNPRGAGAIAAMTLHRGGLATSGDYERCLEVDGQRFGHIINPFTGWPVQGLASVTVVAPSCLLAGAVSTLAMLQGRDAGLEFLSTCGLQWMAHDGHFSYPGGDCMLEQPKLLHSCQPERNAKHANISCNNPSSNTSHQTSMAGDFTCHFAGDHGQLVAATG
jgi:thiamine biosynthesis lipoprotein